MCVTPIILKNEMIVGCGRCVPCHIKYCNQWAYRFNIHLNHNPIAYCITMTYNNLHLPIITDLDTNRNYMSLSKRDIQLFMKKLRKAHVKRYGKLAPKISYLISGEYGDKFKRPHYHAIIFNAHADDILNSWTDSNGEAIGQLYFGQNDIQATLKYALKYTIKSKIHTYYHKNSHYIRPFVLVSKGIGEQMLVTKKKSIRGINTKVERFVNISIQSNVLTPLTSPMWLTIKKLKSFFHGTIKNSQILKSIRTNSKTNKLKKSINVLWLYNLLANLSNNGRKITITSYGKQIKKINTVTKY